MIGRRRGGVRTLVGELEVSEKVPRQNEAIYLWNLQNVHSRFASTHLLVNAPYRFYESTASVASCSTEVNGENLGGSLGLNGYCSLEQHKNAP